MAQQYPRIPRSEPDELRPDHFRSKFDEKQCKLVVRDSNYRHRLALDAVKLKLKPFIRRCHPHPDVAPLFKTYKRTNYLVYRRSHNERKCPIGYRKQNSVDNYTMFFRYDTTNYTDEEWESGFDFSTPQWWNFPYNKFDSLEHLRPNESYLENQRQAISAFLASCSHSDFTHSRSAQ
ncbi:unnamed protein product [Echinostoma caproni]|uniref:Uncharacterized protein n=1 Tax=Echinostoma caproni TaxID=27848 RepID=A0A183B278_9TREM|nr:unnamed protein product [Echinostoma caproni]